MTVKGGGGKSRHKKKTGRTPVSEVRGKNVRGDRIWRRKSRAVQSLPSIPQLGRKERYYTLSGGRIYEFSSRITRGGEESEP